MKRITFAKYAIAVSCLITLIALNATAEQLLKQPASLKVDPQVAQAACDGNCRSKTCQCCEAVCCPVAKEEEVKKHCWKVTPQLVCIPGFRWPWQCFKSKRPDCGDCCNEGCEKCTPPCGRVRCVNVLEKHEYTCKKCGYEWTVKKVCTAGCSCDPDKPCCPDCGCSRCD